MRPFFLHIIRKGKRNYKIKQERKDKAREQAKESRHRNTRTKGQKQEQRDKTKGKRRKAKEEKQEQTRRKPLIRLTTHAHKSPASHAKHPNNTNPHKHHKTPSERPKNAKQGHICKPAHQRRSERAGKRQGVRRSLVLSC